MNQLKMELIHSIQTLCEQGWSARRIARELGVHRKTVRQYLRRRQVEDSPPVMQGGSKAAISTPGSEAKPALPACQGAGRSIPGNLAGRRSDCEAVGQVIEAACEKGLSAQRIWQDLAAEHGFRGSYQSVKRYLRRLKRSDPQRVWRMECLAGEEVQVDFGTGWWLVHEGGRRRKAHIFRVTLSFSRKSYSEAVLRQDTETFLRCLENAFRYFEGVSVTVNLDNLKAAVIHADWYDPEINPKLVEFARHYGTAILPTRPRKPEHKGKIEAGIKYVQNNGLKGRTFTSLAALNEWLRHWETTVADLRIHGTTRKQVGRYFLEAEKTALKPLPPSLFPCYREGQRHVHRDSYIEVAHAYYQVPCEYIGRVIWARWDGHMVRALNHRMEVVATHVQVPPGKFSTVLGAQGRPCTTIEESQRYWGERATRLGVHAGAWAEAIFEQRGPIGLRVVQGLVALSRNHASTQIDQACAKALTCSQWRLQELRAWIEDPATVVQTFSFLESHPLIRDMDAYGAYVGPFEESPPTPTTLQSAEGG